MFCIFVFKAFGEVVVKGFLNVRGIGFHICNKSVKSELKQFGVIAERRYYWEGQIYLLVLVSKEIH